MNTTIMAQRSAQAVQRITAETERLGGRLEIPAVRAPNPQVKAVLTLEAIAEALAAIGMDDGDGQPVEVEPVEAVISVVKEDEDKPAPKKRPALLGAGTR